MIKVAVVILNWNGVGYLQRFLPALVQHTQMQDVEIVVADNGSTDTSVEMLRSDYPNLRLLLLNKNYGFAAGYNKALQQIEAEYYVLLNSDVEVTPGWLSGLLGYMEKNTDVAACQPKIRAYHRRNYFEYAGACGGFIDKYGFPFCRGRIFNTTEEDTGQYDNPVDIFWATGACMMVRSQVYHELGGLDENFFAHMEEIDLCWRMQNRNHRLVCIPQSMVYHVGGGTLNAEHPYKTYLNYRNNLLMLYKNVPHDRLRKTMFVRYFFDYIAVLQMCLTGKFKSARSVFKARHDYKKMRRQYTTENSRNLSAASNIPHPMIYSKSIIIQYFLKGKKKYSEL